MVTIRFGMVGRKKKIEFLFVANVLCLHVNVDMNAY